MTCFSEDLECWGSRQGHHLIDRLEERGVLVIDTFIPQCCTNRLKQAARYTPKYRRHCVFLAAAEIVFVFNVLVTHQPPAQPLTRSLFPQPLPHPSPPSSLAPPFSTVFAKHNENIWLSTGLYVVSVSGHLHWRSNCILASVSAQGHLGWVERESARWSSLKRQERTTVDKMNINIIPKATLWKSFRERGRSS